MFMNTQQLPKQKTAKAKQQQKSFGNKFKGGKLELSIDDDHFSKAPSGGIGSSQSIKSRPTTKKTLIYAENNNFDAPSHTTTKTNFKGDDPTNFANENVMSKSNLRQPKSFNFGFPDDDSQEDSEESKGGNEEIQDYFESNLSTKKSQQPKLQPPSMKRNAFQKPLSLEVDAPEQHRNEEPQQLTVPPRPIQRKNLFLGGTTGATSDEEQFEHQPGPATIAQDIIIQEEETKQEEEEIKQNQEEEEMVEEDQEAEEVGPKHTKHKAVIAYQKKSKLFTNANQKLNIDTDAINELFNYGGEKGQIMMSEDEEMRQLEAEIEELSSQCIAAMNRKRPTDPIKYENKKTKSSFESKYLKSESQGAVSEVIKQSKNPRKQFMTPQSVRGIKKIEFSMSIEERNAALEYKDQISLGESSYGSSSAYEGGLSSRKDGFSGLKSGLLSQNMILEEDISAGGDSSNNSNSSTSKQHDINFPELLSSSSGDPFNNYGGTETKPLNDNDVGGMRQNVTFAKMPTVMLDESEQCYRLSDEIMIYNSHPFVNQGPKELDEGFGAEQHENTQLASQQSTQELENLYTSCLEWIISRAPSSLYENIVIDECDKVTFIPAIQLLMTLVTYSNNLIRQRALTDLEMLAKWDSSNGMQIMMLPQFHTWLLELLMPYQDLENKYSKLQGSALAVYDIGCKLHTLLLKNACSSSEEEAYKKVNFVARWPNILQIQLNQGIKDRTEQDIETANKLSRVLLTQLISALKDESSRTKPLIGKNATSPTWHNIVYISYLVEEMIFGSHNKEIMQAPDDIQDSGRDFNGQPLFKWIHDEGYLLYYFGSNEKSLWAEWDLLESLFSAIESLYPEWTLKAILSTSTSIQQSFSVEESIYSLLEKTSSADEFNSIVEILVQDQTPYKSQQNQFHQPVQQKPAKKGLLGNVLEGVGLSSHFKSSQNVGSSSSSNNQSNQQQQTSDTQFLSQTGARKGEQSLMCNILNMLCIALTQSDTKQLVLLWLERFERFTKFLMIVSESWKSLMVNTLYNTYQRKFTEAITFAITFLFHEIHASNRTTTPTHQQSMNFGSSSSSPKDQIKFSKLYAQSLKQIMIYFINIIEYSKIKYTPSQLESHVTACRYIFNSVLVKTYQSPQYGTTSVENLISLKDISRFKQSDYEDFPEFFYLDEWKVTFFYNEPIKSFVRRHLSLQHMQSHHSKRKSYASHFLETQTSNEKTKEEIIRRMQFDTIDVIGQLSEEEFERKNKTALLTDHFIRLQGQKWKQEKLKQISGSGVWNSEATGLEMKWQSLGDGTRAVMEDLYGNQKFKYFENMPDLEKKIFGKTYQSMDTLAQDGLEFDILLLSKYPWLSNLTVKTERPKKSLRGILISEDETTPKISEEDIDENMDDDEDNAGNPFADTKQKHAGGVERDSKLSKQETSTKDVVSCFSRMLTPREKLALRKNYMNILKDQIFISNNNSGKVKDIINDMKCEVIKPFYKRSGHVSMTSHDIIFFDELISFEESKMLQLATHHQGVEHENTDNIFFFKYKKRPDALYYKLVPLQDLKEIQRRRWLGRKTALELLMMDGKTLTLNFTSQEDREQFAKKVLRQRNLRCCNLKYYDTLEPRRILKKRELTERWMQWKISNFEYITLLNQLAGRSYNDLSQYPVFPWIILDYISQTPPDITQQHNSPMGAPQGFRDLNKNMQLLGSAERQAEFKKKYDDPDSFETLQERFHCGSHYSNPGIVLHYLSRLAPYTDALVQLHGKNLDTPDRGFHSVHESLMSALHDHADVRELIPEFYYCPELFINQNRINFGRKQDGQVVDDVQLPQWCQNDPYLFVIYLREAFESQYVSQNISSWIDFIFGYKQKDAEAERALNTFSKVTYEDGVDIDSVQDPMIKQSYQEQIYNYGQTPSQLFQKQQKHPLRVPRTQALKYNLVVDALAKIKVYKPVVQQSNINKAGGPQTMPQQVLISQEAILRAKFVDDQTIVGLSKDGNITYFFWLSKAHELNPSTPFTCCEEKKRKFDNSTKAHGLDHYDRSIKRFEFPMLILNHQKCVMRGGFWGGKISICPVEGLSQEQPYNLNAHQSTVTAIVATSKERTVITGTKAGDVIVWTFNGIVNQSQSWNVKKHLCDHEGMISSIHINEDMCMYLTSSFDGSVNIYNLWTDKFTRKFIHPKLSPIHSAILTKTPLPACCFFSREDHFWYSYSMNNSEKMLEKQREECSHMISPHVIKDSHFMERLVYGTEKGYLIFRQLPLLKQVKKLQVSVSFPVLSLIVSPDRRFLLVGCGDGGLNVVTEPFILQQQFGVQSNPYQQTTTATQPSSSSSLHNSSMLSSMAQSFVSAATTNTAASGTMPPQSARSSNVGLDKGTAAYRE